MSGVTERCYEIGLGEGGHSRHYFALSTTATLFHVQTSSKFVRRCWLTWAKSKSTCDFINYFCSKNTTCTVTHNNGCLSRKNSVWHYGWHETKSPWKL